MSDKNWFRKREDGGGWVPANSKGWLVTVLFMIYVIGGSTLQACVPGIIPFRPFMISIGVLTALLLVLCYYKSDSAT